MAAESAPGVMSRFFSRHCASILAKSKRTFHRPFGGNTFWSTTVNALPHTYPPMAETVRARSQKRAATVHFLKLLFSQFIYIFQQHDQHFADYLSQEIDVKYFEEDIRRQARKGRAIALTCRRRDQSLF
jgi:hypothetical protein